MGTQPHPTPAPLSAEGREPAESAAQTPELPRFASRPAPRSTVMCISSEALLAGAMEVQIEHRGALYRLKQTSLGKLILTK